MKSKGIERLSIEKIHEKIHELGFFSVPKWATAQGFNPKLTQKVIERWVKNTTLKTNSPRGNSLSIYKALQILCATKTPVKIQEKITVDSDWLNFKEAVVYLRINREKTLRNWISKGVIPHVKEPSTGCLRFHKKALDSWLLRGER